MIISASRRTDIPAFCGEWMTDRLRAGYCLVANPFNPRQVSRISLALPDVDAIVFWTKNPRPFLAHLDEIDRLGHRYYFLFTVNSYPAEIEPAVPPLAERLETFRALSRRIGAGRTIWRYDPIILSRRLSASFHRDVFARLAQELRGHTRRVIVSFLDLYRKTERRLQPALERAGDVLVREPFDRPDTRRLALDLMETAARHEMEIQSCAEDPRIEAMGLPPGKCIDDALIRREFGVEVKPGKDPGQRDRCLCVRSRDIGAVNTCLHGCVYCYSTSNDALARAGKPHGL